MPFAVEMDGVVREVPLQVQLCLRDALDEITEVIGAVPPGSSELMLLRNEPLQLDLMGWRFWYEVDPEGATVRVVGVRELK